MDQHVRYLALEQALEGQTKFLEWLRQTKSPDFLVKLDTDLRDEFIGLERLDQLRLVYAATQARSEGE